MLWNRGQKKGDRGSVISTISFETMHQRWVKNLVRKSTKSSCVAQNTAENLVCCVLTFSMSFSWHFYSTESCHRKLSVGENLIMDALEVLWKGKVFISCSLCDLHVNILVSCFTQGAIFILHLSVVLSIGFMWNFACDTMFCGGLDNPPALFRWVHN